MFERVATSDSGAMPVHGDGRGVWAHKGEAYARSDMLMSFPEFLASYGVDCLPLLDEVGIARRALNETSSLISWERLGHLNSLAAEACNEPDFGLKHAIFLPRYSLVGREERDFRFGSV